MTYSRDHRSRPDPLSLSSELSWLDQASHGFVPGGIYLLAGAPGIGKSTLSIQIAIARGLIGFPTLYLLTEQAEDEAYERALGIVRGMGVSTPEDCLSRIRFCETTPEPESLSRAWSRARTWAKDAALGDIRIVILDSVQGHGLSANSKSYKLILNFAKMLKDEATATVLLSHITKSGSIAGPRTLEHAVDCVLVMRKAMSYRPLFISKNRFGQTPNNAIPLIMSKKTTGLVPSPHKETMVAVANAVIPGATELNQAQVNISIPRTLDQKGKISTVGLPKKVVEQLLASISYLVDPELSDLDFRIQCNVAGAGRYSNYICFAMAMAIIASYIRRTVPEHLCFIGEVDLTGSIRPIAKDVITGGGCSRQRYIFYRLPIEYTFVMAESSVEDIGPFLPPSRKKIGCKTIADAVTLCWPDALGEAQ